MTLMFNYRSLHLMSVFNWKIKRVETHLRIWPKVKICFMNKFNQGLFAFLFTLRVSLVDWRVICCCLDITIDSVFGNLVIFSSLPYIKLIAHRLKTFTSVNSNKMKVFALVLVAAVLAHVR